MSSSTSHFYDRHYPDEYVDSALSLDAEMNENRDLPTAKEIFRYFFPLKRFRNDNDTKEAQPWKATSDVNLTDYHFPDEYCDAALFSCEDSTTDSEDGALPSQHIVGSLLSFGWLRDGIEHTDATLDESFSSYLNSSDCDLPDAFIDSTLVQYSSAAVTNHDVTSSGSDVLIDSISSFMASDKCGEESDDGAAVSSNNIRMDSCHLPDDYVDAVVSYDGEPITKSVTTPPVTDKRTDLSSPLDHLNTKISKVLSFGRSKNEIRSDSQLTNKAVTPSKTSQRNHVAWEKSKSIHSVDSEESSVPKAKDSRAGSSLRKRTPSKKKVDN